ncbi:ABC transporter substrate-binding protein [Rhodocyclaceae bacterium SMB388]
MREGLAAQHPRTTIDSIQADAFDGLQPTDARIVVTVGSVAAKAVRQHAPPVPVLNAFIPRDSYLALGQKHPAPEQVSAIFMDQPVARQIALIAEALPDWRILALIYGPGTSALASEITVAAQRDGFDVRATPIDSDRELYQAMQRTLSQPAVLIAVPDRSVYNSHTIQNILLTSYRYRSPLIGFSPAYVRAGALLAIYATPEQIGKQAADAVSDVLNGLALPPPAYPVRFEVDINATVGRSLSIRLDSAEEIAQRIRDREARR